MTMTKRSSHSLVPFTAATKKALRDLFLLLQHPYIMPINHIEILPEQKNVVFAWNLCIKGSLKDSIYRCNPIYPAEEKYRMAGHAIPLNRLVVAARQIVEGLLFLKKMKLPHRNLHTGNVLLDHGVCRAYGPSLYPFAFIRIL